jgi:hypothetical protein
MCLHNEGVPALTNRFLQIITDDVILATVGTRADTSNHFAVWDGDFKNADGTEATPYVVIFAAGSKVGLPFDDHDTAWLQAVAEGHRIAASNGTRH